MAVAPSGLTTRPWGANPRRCSAGPDHKPSFTLDTYVHLLDEDVPEPTFFDAISAPCDTGATQTGRNERESAEAAEGGKA